MTEREYAEVARRIARVRRIYSEIGEPLAAETIARLYGALGKTLRWTEKYGKRKRLRH